MQIETGELINITDKGNNLFHLIIKADKIADKALPGQFIQVYCSEGESYDPLLPRPFSLFRIEKEKGCLELVFRVVGRGTSWLSKRRTGSSLKLLGPLGRGFTDPREFSRVLLFAGGIGMPPLFSVAEVSKEVDFTLFYGARSQGELIFLERWQQMTDQIFLATDDGSAGQQGNIVELASSLLDSGSADFYYACGPRPMLKAVKRLMAKLKIPGELSLEERMACGVGACLGCVCRTTSGYARVCTEGPVFAAEEVVFDE